jgi:hypothetical protein
MAGIFPGHVFTAVQVLTESVFVMRGLDPRIHLLAKGWIAGSSPAMTNEFLPSKIETL